MDCRSAERPALTTTRRRTAALLSLVNEAPSSSSGTSPTTLAYLRHALAPATRLVKPGQLARQAFEMESPSAATLDVILEVVSSVLDSWSSGTPPYAAATAEEQLQALAMAGSNLSALSGSSNAVQSPTTTYILRLFTSLPLASSFTGSSSSSDALTALNSASSALATMKPLPTDAAFLQQLLQAISTVRGQLAGSQTGGAARQPAVERLGCPFNLDEAPLKAAEADLALLMQSLVRTSRSPSAFPVRLTRFDRAQASPLHSPPSPFTPSTRIVAAFRARALQAPSRGSTTEKALECALLEMLLAATEELRAGGEPKKREEAWAFSRVRSSGRA